MGYYNGVEITSIYTVIIICFLFLGHHHVNASIHEYKNEGFIPRFNSFFFHGGSEGLFASMPLIFDHPSSDDNPLIGNSFIRFESITFTRPRSSAAKQNPMQQRTGLVEAIVVEVKDRDKLGMITPHSTSTTITICCTPDLAKDGVCKVGQVILRPDPDKPGSPQRIQTFFEGDNTAAKMVFRNIRINATGMYYLYFVVCDPQLKDTVVNGRTVWRNPQGYLPGKMTPFVPFFGFMSFAYLLLGLVWFVQFLKCWKDVIQLHYQITAVIGLGMTEMALWYFEYSNFNSTGTRPTGITVWAVTFSAVKKTVARVLLLVVSMGYGVVRPTLAGITSRVLLLGVLFFMASEALELVEHLGNVNDLNGRVKLVFVLPVALLDACFIFWIFSSLSKTLEKLQIRKSMVKLELYRKFTNSLAVAVLLSVVWIGYELYFNASDPLSEMWQRAWIIPAFWTVLSYCLLVVICLLFTPSHNQTRYAYGEDMGDDTEEESISLTSSRAKVGGGDVVGAKLERKERKPSVGGGLELDHAVVLPQAAVAEDKRE